LNEGVALLLALGLWQAEAWSAFATTGDLKGPAAGVTVLREVNGWFALGATVDSARLGASGVMGPYAAPGNLGPIGGPYSYAALTTFAGAAAQFRLPFSRFLASADLAAGWVAVHTLDSENTQCSYGSGFNLRLGAGLAFAASEHLLLGLRTAARSPAFTQACTLMFGQFAFNAGPVISLGPTLALRF